MEKVENTVLSPDGRGGELSPWGMGRYPHPVVKGGTPIQLIGGTFPPLGLDGVPFWLDGLTPPPHQLYGVPLVGWIG